MEEGNKDEIIASQNEIIKHLKEQNEKLKKTIINMQTTTEIEEESITNKLMKTIDELKEEKRKVLLQLEKEEIQLNQTLTTQLEQSRKEKIQIETMMEREQEYLVNKLRKEINQLSHSRERSNSDPHEMRLFKEAKSKITSLEKRLKEVELDLETEKGRNKILLAQIESLKVANIEMHNTAEQQEEYISNMLLKRISGLKKEKEELLIQVEREEEYLTNTLNKKVSMLLQEKKALESALENGQQTMVDHLQKRLDGVRSNSPVHFSHTDTSKVPSEKATISEIREYAEDLQEKYNDIIFKHSTYEKEGNVLKQEVKKLREDNLILQHKLQREQEKIGEMEKELIKLEINEERYFNLSESRIESRSRSGSLNQFSPSPSNSGMNSSRISTSPPRARSSSRTLTE